MHLIYISLQKALLLCLLIFFAAACVTDQANSNKRANALENLGNSLVAQGNQREGLAKLLESVKLQPDNADAHHQIALIYRFLGEYDSSELQFKKALSIRPDFSEASNNLGTLYLLLQRWDEAIACFKRAASNILYTTPHFAYHNMGWAYYKKGEYPKAMESYRRALEILPSFGPCYVKLGLVYEKTDRWEDAITAYHKALEYFPDYPLARLNLGRIYMDKGWVEAAERELEKTIESDPKGPYAEEARRLMEKIR